MGEFRLGAAASRRDRWLICVELQRDSVACAPRNAAVGRQLETCRTLLAQARDAGWPVVHVHLRRPADGRGVLPSARPIAGFEPLPSEAVFFRDGGPNCCEDPFWRLTEAAEGSQALVIGFINDRACAGAVASLSRAGVRVTLVEDALGGVYAHAYMERRVASAFADDLAPQPSRPLQLEAANSP